MSILSWNCRGAGNTEVVRRLTKMRKKLFPDFLFLMETKQKNSYMSGLQKDLSYDKMVTVEPIGLSGGLALYWSASISVSLKAYSMQLMDIRVKTENGVEWRTTLVYG